MVAASHGQLETFSDYYTWCHERCGLVVLKIKIFCVCTFPSTSSEPYEIVGAVVVKILMIGGSRDEPVVLKLGLAWEGGSTRFPPGLKGKRKDGCCSPDDHYDLLIVLQKIAGYQKVVAYTTSWDLKTGQLTINAFLHSYKWINLHEWAWF